MDWDIAHSLPPKRRRAYVVFYGQLDGGEWDFARGRWKEKPKGSDG